MVDSAFSRSQFILQEWPDTRWTSLSLFGSPSAIESGVAMNGRARRGETPREAFGPTPMYGKRRGASRGASDGIPRLNIVEMASLKSAGYTLNINYRTISDCSL